MKTIVSLFVFFFIGIAVKAQIPAFPGAEGFGALSKGGRGGDVYHVTTLDDWGAGSLREGIVSAKGPRTIVFDVGGTIKLASTLKISGSYLTIAGQTAPGDGICIRDYSVNIQNASDIVIRYIRIRRGDEKIRESGQPTGSTGLDCVSIDDSKNIIFDHVSLSWSCDEIFGIVQNQNVTIQWCLLAEPLGDPLVHPYGKEHAYCMNNSATTLSIHHCLLANYVMRGPNFEVNDATANQGYHVYKEAVNNVLFDYKKSGSRYTCGIETNPGNAYGIDFRFHYIGNRYITSSAYKAQEIQATPKYGITDQLKVYVNGNIGPNRLTDTKNQWDLVQVEGGGFIRDASPEIKAQMSDTELFKTPIPVTTQSAADAYTAVLEKAGCNIVRDAVDKRIVSYVTKRDYNNYLLSQSEVGGWPELKSGTPMADTDRDGMSDIWETSNGLDKNNPEDRNGDNDSDGYTNLEEYLNSFGLVTSAQQLEKPGYKLRIYPNPAIHELKAEISLPEDTKFELTILNQMGQKVWGRGPILKQTGEFIEKLDLTNLTEGIYFIVLQSDDYKTTKSFVLRN